MKQIKFRGLRTDGKGWVEGYYFNAKGSSKMLIDRIASNHEDWKYKDVNIDTHLILTFQPPNTQGWDYGQCTRFNYIHPESLAMFTGLTDKNGKEIFGSIDGSKGGDRAKVQLPMGGFWGDVKTEKIGNVRYCEDRCRFIVEWEWSKNQHHVDLTCDTEIEIIGNQYEPQNQ